MTHTTIVVISAVAAVLILLLIAIIIIGLKRKKDKTVSFEKHEEPKELSQQEKSGNYQAVGGFNFAPASSGGKAPQKEPVATPRPEPEQHNPAAFVADTERPAVPSVADENETASTRDELDSQSVSFETRESVVAEPEAHEPEAYEPEDEGVCPEKSEHPADEDAAPAEATAGVAPAPYEAHGTDGRDPGAHEPEDEGVCPEEPERASDEALTSTEDEERVEADGEREHEPDHAAAHSEPPAPTTSTASPTPQTAHIDPAEGRLGRLRGRLSRSQSVIGQGVLGILSAGDLDEDAWEEIEDTLIMADLGSTATMKVVDDLRDMIAARGVSSEEEARAMVKESLIKACKPELDRSVTAIPSEGKPAVVLVVGVNGTGKTTTTGKLARVLVSMGHTVLLGAADTFRAAAADQLETWGTRVGATTVRGKEGADPASVAFDAVATGISEHADVVLIDTAGRLHTSQGLMDQLGKVKRVVEKKTHVDEVLLVLDATVGQNGLIQARTFRDVVDITGVVLTKLDGTAKGGIVFQVQEELGVPVKLVGLGEGADDLAPFEPESFVNALLG